MDSCGVCGWHPTEATMRHVSIVGGPRSQPVVFQQSISISNCPTVDCVSTKSKKIIIAKRVRQITLICTKSY